MSSASRAANRRPAGPWIAAAAALALTALLFAVRAALDGGARLWFTGRLLHWWMPVVLLLAAAPGARCLRQAGWRPVPWLRGHAPVLLAALCVTLLCALRVDAALRVQFDETNLLSTSRNMHEVRAAFVTTQAVPYEGAPQPVEFMVDKRPPLFPFLVSLLHDLTGFRIANAFALNLGVLFLLLATIGTAVQRRAGALHGAAAVLLLASVPLVLAGARSAGFELLALLLGTWVVLAALAFARAPSPPHHLWLLAALLLFAHARYESLAVGAVALGVALWRARSSLPPRRALPQLLLLAPLLVPLAFLFLHATDPDFYPEADERAVLGLHHALAHLPGLLATFFDPGPASPFAGPLAWLALLVLAATLVRRRWSLAHTQVALPVLAATAIALAWFYGDAREPSAWRLYLPAVALAAVLPATCPLRPAAGAALLLGSALWFGFRLEAVRTGRAFPELKAAQVAACIDAALARLAGQRGETLVVTTAAQYAILRGFAALTPDGLARHAAVVDDLRRRGGVAAVWILETPIEAAMAGRFGSVRALVERTRVESQLVDDGTAQVALHRVVSGF